MPYTYVGKTVTYSGKTLWEIVGSLKNCGKGRMVIPNRYKRYPEPTYYRIEEAQPDMDPELKTGKMKVYVVFRGLVKGIYTMDHTAYKPDYQLVPKAEEHLYVEAARNVPKPVAKVFPRTADMPPLLKIITDRHETSQKVLETFLTGKDTRLRRVAEEGETPTVQIPSGLGTPLNKDIYKGVRKPIM